MLKFGYDQFNDDTWEIIKPNGLVGQEEVPETYRLYLPPWYGEIFQRYEIPFQIRSSSELIQEKNKDKWLYMLEPNGDPRGWFGMFDDENPNPIKSLFAGMDRKSLQSCREGQLVICLWQPNEGFPSEWININVFEEIYKELDRFDISPNNFLYVCGNWKIEIEYKRWKEQLTEKYKDWQDIHLCAFNNERYLDFKTKWGGQLSKFDSSLKREKLFVCFNRELRPHRKLFLTMMMEANLMDVGMISSKKFDIETFFRVPKEFGLRRGITKKLKEFAEKLVEITPLVVDVDEWDTNHFDTSNKWVYDSTYFSLITTTWFGEDTVFFDEKIWKPMANEHPFLVVGNYKVLEELRRQKFKTFHPHIDESYDLEPHPYKRMKMIIKEIQRLSKFSLHEMNQWYKKLQPILEHNNKQLYSLDSLNELTAKFNDITKGK
jgi:hypothetical protein|tara:strand:- start:885 stop:2183 length:1299 start_codon:yes stop_codon:yes gene_type:complete